MQDPLRALLQKRIALGVGNDRNDPPLSHLADPIINLLGNAEITELDQQVATVRDAKLLRRLERSLHVLKREVKVTPQAQLRGWADSLLKGFEQMGKILAIVVIVVVGMRGCDDMLSAILGCHAAHLFGNFPRLRAVVHFRQDVTVNINHAFAI